MHSESSGKFYCRVSVYIKESESWRATPCFGVGSLPELKNKAGVNADALLVMYFDWVSAELEGGSLLKITNFSYSGQLLVKA